MPQAAAGVTFANDPYASVFDLIDYTVANGCWRLHFVARTPPPGNLSDIYVDILETELPANINQNTLTQLLKTRLGYTLNKTFAPLNQFIANGTTITLP